MSKEGDFMKKRMPVGYEDLKQVIDKGLYYVDKTRMIKELLDFGGMVNLFTRPRRFGKTLNQSMLLRFFEMELNGDGSIIDNSYLFQNLEIASAGEKYLSCQGKFPVISLSLKSAKQPDFEMAYESLIDEIAKEYRRHDYVLMSQNLTESEKQRFTAVRNREAEKIEYAKSLEFLSYCLARYHQKSTIILLDEYDVPLENAYFEGFYDEMASFIRSLFESALKTNPNLEFAVITGRLRIRRESIFTGLNNLDVYSVLKPDFADCFGFTPDEVKETLYYYGMEDKFEEVKEWYDGYCFGRYEIYNPWSIIKELVETADFEVREELLAGKQIEKPVHADITYGDIHESEDNLWNFLFFTGYIKKTGEGRAIVIELKVAETFGGMVEGCKAAMNQIESRGYEAGLRTEGYQNIRKYGSGFYRKECLMMEAEA